VIVARLERFDLIPARPAMASARPRARRALNGVRFERQQRVVERAEAGSRQSRPASQALPPIRVRPTRRQRHEQASDPLDDESLGARAVLRSSSMIACTSSGVALICAARCGGTAARIERTHLLGLLATDHREHS